MAIDKGPQGVAATSHFDDLNEDQLAEVERRLMNGDTAKNVLAFVRKEYKLWTGPSSDSTMCRTINRYRNKRLKPQMLQKYNALMHQVGAVAVQKKIDTMGELRALAETQKTRFLKMYDKEKNAPLLMDVVTKEAMNLQKMLFDLAKLEMDMGLIVRAPRTVSGTLTDEHGRPRSFNWTEEQAELLNVLEGVTYSADSH